MLSLHGYIVTGLEISAKGIETAKEYAQNELSAPQSYNFRSIASTTSTGSSKSDSGGSVEFIQGDFFEESESFRGQFDVIYDYTVSPSPSPSPSQRAENSTIIAVAM